MSCAISQAPVELVLSQLSSGLVSATTFVNVLSELVTIVEHIPNVEDSEKKEVAIECLRLLSERLPYPDSKLVPVLMGVAPSLFDEMRAVYHDDAHKKTTPLINLPRSRHIGSTGHKFLLRKQSADSRDIIMPLSKDVSLPSSYDLRDTGLMPPTLNQGTAGTCGANAAANAMHYLLRKEDVGDWSPSRLYIYYTTRVYEEGVPPAMDSGVTLRDLVRALSHYHCCDETLMPYSDKLIAMPPSAMAVVNANQHTQIKYMAVPNSEVAMKSAIAEGYPIIIGVQIYSSFETAEVMTTGKVPMPDFERDSLLGGHALLLCAFHDDTKTFTVQNSWGGQIAKDGYFEIPYDYLLNPDLCADMWVLQYFA